ncbi:hypothetical protein [Embleya sp. NBC_00888]|uniref:hypothetical protein n=1 Tax=Embleya sp. NBC_00888 TaxID=2975960 RepID=UPI00386CD8DD
MTRRLDAGPGGAMSPGCGGGRTSRRPRDRGRRGQAVAEDHPQRHRAGGDPAASPHEVRHLFAAYDPGTDRLYGHLKPRKNRTRFPEFRRCLRSLHPPQIRIAIVLDNLSPHPPTKKDTRVGDWAAANNVEADAEESAAPAALEGPP